MTTPSANPSHTIACPCCNSSELETIYEVKSLPTTSNLLMQTCEEATNWPRGSLLLKYCRGCGFMFNSKYDPSTQEHSSRYEATQGHSATFSSFAKSLAEKWRDRHNLRDKRLLEIGCLQGEFITQLCEVSDATGIGIDPVLDPSRTPPQARGRVEFIKDFYGPKYANLEIDFIVCRHTLEHIETPYSFLKSIRDAIGDRNITIGFEVPDTQRVLDEGAFWDIYYEHCSYFTRQSLRSLFERVGFNVVHESLEYDGQYLIIDAIPAQPSKPHPPLGLDTAVAHASFALIESRITWEELLRVSREKRIALWGSGSKAVGFLSTLDLSHDCIPFVVDINPHKRGTYLPGTGQQIILPQDLKAYDPQVVIAMNPIYKTEISRDLEALGLRAELLTL